MFAAFCFLTHLCVCLLQTGMGGHYVLDEYGDRDVNFSMIYTSTKTCKVRLLSIQQLAQSVQRWTFILYFVSVSLQYETLLVFDSSQNKTIEMDTNPALTWEGNKFPSSVPKDPDGKTHIHTDGVEIVRLICDCLRFQATSCRVPAARLSSFGIQSAQNIIKVWRYDLEI